MNLFKKLLYIPVVFSMMLFSAATIASERPKIGLALSGGGAKGAAHVGVLKILEQNNIPVDYIAGTSIGAYVGGLYALGYSASDIETIMLETDWKEGFTDSVSREDLSYREKQQRDQYNLPLNIGLKDGNIQIPNGVLLGQRMSQIYRNTTGLVREFDSFDELAIPYRAVATDLETSQAVIIDHGSLVKAMQSSATVPGALQPSKFQERLLVDGGISNNMPVDVVKSMGADIVIAVDISAPLSSKEELTNAVAVIAQLSRILTNTNTERQRQLLTSKDILIRPDVSQLSTTDFNDMPEALIAGINAATTQSLQLSQYAVSTAAYEQYSHNKQVKSAQWFDHISQPVVNIVFNNKSGVNQQLIKNTFDIHVGNVVNKDELDKGIDRLYSLNKFQRVDAEFKDTAEGRILIVTTIEKSWGPNYFQFGFNWEDNFTLDSTATIEAALTMTDLTLNGGEWRNELKFGIEKLFATEFYQPLDQQQNIYSRLRYQYEIKNWELFNTNSLELELDRKSNLVNLGIGYNYVPQGRIELGFVGEVGQISNTNVINEFDFSSYGGYLKFGYDSLDSISFPTSGNRFNVNLYWREERFDSNIFDYADGDLFQIDANWKGVVSVGNHSFVGKAAYASVSKDENFTIYVSDLGGFLNLSGYYKNSLAGAQKVFGAFVYQYDLGQKVLGMSDFPLYLGTSLEAGNVWDVEDHVEFNDLIYASSLFLGTDTPLGPAALGFGFSDDGEEAIYIFIGKTF